MKARTIDWTGICDNSEDVLHDKLVIKANRDVFIVQQKKVKLVQCLTIEVGVAEKASFRCLMGNRFFVYSSGHSL